MAAQNVDSAQTQEIAKFHSDLDDFVRSILSARLASVEDINKSLAGNRKQIEELKTRAKALALDFEHEAAETRERVKAVLEKEELERRGKQGTEAL